MFVYIILGRVQRIAFERRLWLVEKCIILYGILLQVVDEAKCVVRAVAIIEGRTKTQQISNKRMSLLSSILKLITFFVVVSVLVAAAVIAETILMATLHVLTNGVLLYRAYGINNGNNSISSGNGSNPQFLSRINDFFFAIGQFLGLNSFINPFRTERTPVSTQAHTGYFLRRKLKLSTFYVLYRFHRILHIKSFRLRYTLSIKIIMIDNLIWL